MISLGFLALVLTFSGSLPCTQSRPEVLAGGISLSSPALCANFSGIHHYVYLGEGAMSLEEDISAFLPPSCLAPAFSTLPPLLHSVKTLGKVIASCYRFTLARGLQDSNPSLKLIPRH